ncbi:MAG: glycosyltransferase family 10 [Chlamydiae bacterium]|nr:glycosyltransferase family 10 [Chlamydiota bacterium]
MSLKAILFFLFFCFSLCSEEKVIIIIANYCIDVNPLSEALNERGVEAKFVLKKLDDLFPPLHPLKKKWLKLGKKMGFDFSIPIQLEKNVEKVVFYNLSNKFFKRSKWYRIPKEKFLLFMWEPPIILSRMYRSPNRFCSKIYTWNDALVDNKTFFKLYYPELQPMRKNLIPFEKRRLSTLVASNFTSKKSNELYSERKKVVEFFEKKEGEDFHFFGRGWDATLFKNYKGAIQNKEEVISHFRFCFCYENSKELKGYITEKIFDCFAAGVVPIYLGAPNIEEYIPKSCFISPKDFENLDELYKFLKNMPRETYEAYLAAIQKFLESKSAQNFSKKNFLKIFCSAVIEKEEIF